MVLLNNHANDNKTLVDTLLYSIESCTSVLHELIVRRDENISKDSGTTDSAEVSLWDKSLVLMYSCTKDEENPKT